MVVKITNVGHEEKTDKPNLLKSNEKDEDLFDLADEFFFSDISDSEIEIETFVNEKPRKKTKKVENNVILTKKGKEFRKLLDYKMSGNLLWRTPKTVIIKLHNTICQNIGLPEMSRNEKRSINNYFNKYAESGVQIVNEITKYLSNNPDFKDKIYTFWSKTNSKIKSIA